MRRHVIVSGGLGGTVLLLSLIVVLAVLALTIGGCASPSFTPYTVEIAGAHGAIDCTKSPDSGTAFCTDLKACQHYAAAYDQSLSVRRLAQATVTGAALNGPAALVSPPTAPVVIGASALSSGASEIAGELGVIGANIDKITAHCLHDKGQKSGAYLVIDPNL